ncbi:MAG: response regulator transcription factor [bacterium]
MTAKENPKKQGKKRKIVVVDDHPLLRQGLAQLINQEDDLVFAGEAGDASEALPLLSKINPDLMIVDISLKGMNGLDLTKNISRDQPNVPVLVISMHDESLYAERALRAGARGYLMKQEATEKVVTAIRKVLSGEVYLSDAMRDGLLNKIVSGRPVSESPAEGLTDRELEVLQLMAQGKGTRQIAEALHLSVKTIESHYANIKNKLNLKNAPELMQYAVKFFHSEA